MDGGREGGMEGWRELWSNDLFMYWYVYTCLCLWLSCLFVALLYIS